MDCSIKRARIGGAQRHDGVEVGHVPAFFEHVDVDDDLGRLVGVLHLQQPLRSSPLLPRPSCWSHLDDLVLVWPSKKLSDWISSSNCFGVRRVAGDHQQNGFTMRVPFRAHRFPAPP